jgi:hypothetical protein
LENSDGGLNKSMKGSKKDSLNGNGIMDDEGNNSP